MKFGLISCALLLVYTAYTIGSILRYRNVDMSQMELSRTSSKMEPSRTLLGNNNNATHHPILATMIVLHDVVSVVMTQLLVHQLVTSPFQNKAAHNSVAMVCFRYFPVGPLEVL